MKKVINSTLSEKENSVAFIAKELLSNNGALFNSLWSENGYIAVAEHFKAGVKNGKISSNWYEKIYMTLQNKCGRYNNNFSKINAQTYLANLMLAGDGMGITNNEIR